MDGFLLALERPEAVGEAFIIAGPRYVTQDGAGGARSRGTPAAACCRSACRRRRCSWAGALCEAVCVPLGLEPPLHRRRVDFWTKSRAFSIEKARRVLGYAPQVDLDEGVARTAALVPRGGLAVSDRAARLVLAA